MIVKVQMPLAGARGDALVYDEARAFQELLPITAALVEAMDGRAKAYFKARVVAQRLVLDAEVGVQSW